MRVIDWVLPTSMQSRTAPSVIGPVARVNGGRARLSSPRYLAAKCVSGKPPGCPVGPVIPTSATNPVPPGRMCSASVASWVWVPRTAAASPSIDEYLPPALHGAPGRIDRECRLDHAALAGEVDDGHWLAGDLHRGETPTLRLGWHVERPQHAGIAVDCLCFGSVPAVVAGGDNIRAGLQQEVDQRTGHPEPGPWGGRGHRAVLRVNDHQVDGVLTP